MTLRTFTSAILSIIAATQLVAIGPLKADQSAAPQDKATPESAAEPVDELTSEAERAAEELTASLPEDSEARAMLDHILDGSRLGPGEGWFARAQAQSRFSWERICEVYDANGDQQVSADEFPGAAKDYARLDRDDDESLTQSDFDYSEHSLARTPGVMLFFQADRDANGKVSHEEFAALFNSLDDGSQGFVTLDELRDQFQPPSDEQSEQQRSQRRDLPSRSTLILGLQRQEIGSLQPGPDVDEAAPDFTLTSLDGEPITLSEQIGKQPIVLIFGNFTCGPFRSQAGNIEKLYDRYRERAKFFLVYVREAHPSDGWWMTSNQRAGIDLSQPVDNRQRQEVAQTCRTHLDLDIPFLVDMIDDRVGSTYSGMPNRLYLIDRDGKIAFKNGRGPFGFHPRQLEQALVLLLNEQTSANGDR